MKITPTQELSKDIIESALFSYIFSSGATTEEKMKIRQRMHIEENNDFKVTAEVNDENNEILVIYSTNNKKYKRTIPTKIPYAKAELYPFGDVSFENIELMAVSLVNGFPWTTEAFVAWYWANVDTESVNLEVYNASKEKARILTQYYPPRKVTSEPPDCTILPEGEFNASNPSFMTNDIRNATHCKTPNPWAYASLMVIYENSDVARNLLESEEVYGDKEEFQLTPPDEFKFSTS